MYQGGCGEASAWGTVVMEAGTELSLNLNGVHSYQMYQGGCGEASAWGTVVVEAGTQCSLHIAEETVVLGRYTANFVYN
jgi:Na+/glutamate symporter